MKELSRSALVLCLSCACSAAYPEATSDVSSRVRQILSEVPEPSLEQREATAQALADIGMPAALEVGKAALLTDGPQPIIAVEALKDMGQPLLTYLCDLLLHTPDVEKRAEAARILRRLSREKLESFELTIDPLLQALDDEPPVREAARIALRNGAIESDKVYLELTRRLVSKEEGYKGLLSSTNCAPEEALRMLVGALADSDGMLRDEISDVLKYHGPAAQSIFPDLVAALYNERASYQLELPALLVRIAGKNAIAPLIDVLEEHPELAIRMAASSTLSEMGACAVPALTEVLASDSFLAANALAVIGSPAEGALARAAVEEDPIIRRNALYAYGRMTTLSSEGRLILERAVDGTDEGDQAMAALALAKHPSSESTLAVLARALELVSGESSMCRVFTDALFRLSTTEETKRSDALPTYEIGSTRAESNTETQSMHRVWLRFDTEEQTFSLSDREGSAEEGWVMGFDASSLRLEWVEPGRLLQVTWSTIAQGNGKYEAASIMLLEKGQGGWRELFRHTGAGNSGGLGSGGADYPEYRFLYSATLKSIRFQHESNSWSQSTQPFALAVWTGWNGWAGEYYRSDNSVAEWPCNISDGVLQLGLGTYYVSPEGEFPASEWAKPDQVRDVLSKNPQMTGRAIWSGTICMDDNIAPLVPDHGMYMMIPGYP